MKKNMERRGGGGAERECVMEDSKIKNTRVSKQQEIFSCRHLMLLNAKNGFCLLAFCVFHDMFDV